MAGRLIAAADVALAGGSRVIMASGRSGPVYGGSGADFVTALATTIPAGAVVGGSLLRLSGLFGKHDPINAGCAWRARIGGVVIAQNAISATVMSAALYQDFFVSTDRKWGFAVSLNAYDAANLTAGVANSPFISKSGSIASVNPGGVSPNFQFSTFSSAPVVETKVIDFDNDQTLYIDVKPINGDTVEIIGFAVEILQPTITGRNYGNAKATVWFGDSLTAGTGSTSYGDAVTRLRVARPGRPVINQGMGGQRISTIIDRALSDPVCGKYWDMILWAGINDSISTNGGADWWAIIYAQIERLRAFRADGTRMIICNLIPDVAMTSGTPLGIAMAYVNTQLSATYGTAVCDLYSALATDVGGVVPASLRSDTIHLSNSGYQIVADTVHAKMTALGWA